MKKKRRRNKKRKSKRNKPKKVSYQKFDIKSIGEISFISDLPNYKLYLPSDCYSWKKIPLFSPVVVNNSFLFKLFLSPSDKIELSTKNLVSFNRKLSTLDHIKSIRIDYKPNNKIFYVDSVQLSIINVTDINEQGFLSKYHDCIVTNGCFIDDFVQVFFDDSTDRYKKISYFHTTIDNIKYTKIDVEPKLVKNVELFLYTDYLKRIEVSLMSLKNEGLLITGVPSIGKTFSFKRIIVDVLKWNLFCISLSTCYDNLDKVLEEKINEMKKFDKNSRKKVLFVDDLDIVIKEKNLISVICKRIFDNKEKDTIIVSACNNFKSIPKLLLRNGRFSRKITLSPPNDSERKEIITKLIVDGYIKIEEDEKNRIITEIVNKTSGFLISDLISLVRESAIASSNDEFCDLKTIIMCLRNVKSSVQRYFGNKNLLDVSENVVKMKWSDIGGLENVKLKLKQCIEWPVIHKSKIKSFGINETRGILLYGPPGCGKTSLVRALAHRVNFSFFFSSTATIYSPYVGEAERNIHSIFSKARISKPSIIFFDEIDSIVGKRRFDSDNNDVVEKRILSTLLEEMDGMEMTEDVVVVAATNRPDMLDDALLRAGRLDYLLYVPPPDKESRFSILRICLGNFELGDESILEIVVNATEGYSGADLQSLCREVIFSSFHDNKVNKCLKKQHFVNALEKVKSSLTISIADRYKKFHNK